MYWYCAVRIPYLLNKLDLRVNMVPSLGCALFWAQVSCYSTQWAENKVTFLIEFGAWEDVDLSLAKLSLGAGSVAGEWRPLQFWRNIPTQIHVFPCSKFQKEGTAMFSSLSSIRWDLSPKKGAHYCLIDYLQPEILGLPPGKAEYDIL